MITKYTKYIKESLKDDNYLIHYCIFELNTEFKEHPFKIVDYDKTIYIKNDTVGRELKIL